MQKQILIGLTIAVTAVLLACAPSAPDSSAEKRPDPALAQSSGESPLPVAKALPTKPAPAPAAFLGLIGEYGDDRNILYIFEQQGQLWSLLKWSFYPLKQLAANRFAFPDSGLYPGEELVFTRDAGDKATEVTAAGTVFKLRKLGPEDGAGQLRVTPLRPVPELLAEALKTEPPEESGEFVEPDFVELSKFDPTIRLDIRYATTNNFLGSVFYSEPRAFLQRAAAEATLRAHRKLRQAGYGLLIHDAYRPWYVTKVFWDAMPDNKKDFVAKPWEGSRHNRGAAVDLTLYDLKTGQPIEMVGTYDETTDRSYPDYPGGTSLQRWHRDLLRKTMEAEGFTVYPIEWWHFDYQNWQQYPIGNVRFDRIDTQSK